MKSAIIKIVFGLFLITLVISCSRNPVTGKKEVMLMSKKQEIALGKDADPSIVAQFGLYDNQTMQTFIQKKGKQMADISHMPNLDFQFKVLDSPVVNAFAVPGGYIYFTRGIMAHFNNEAQFAGVLGHEIGHVTARHSAKSYTKQMIAQVGLFAGLIASEKFRQFANEASQGLGLLFLKFGRDAESQSDKLGVEYSTKVKYNSHEMADFFETLDRLQKQSGQAIPDFLSTHPNPADRHNKLHQHTDEAQKGMNATGLKVNKESYLRMIDGITYGEDPRQGYVKGNMFYHPELLFKFPVPQNWNLINSPSQVQMAPKDGQALMIFTLAQENSLDAAAQKVIKDNQLTVIQSNKTNVNGFEAIKMIATQGSNQTAGQNTGQEAEPLQIMTYLISYSKFIYVFHGLSEKSKFNNYASNFEKTMKGFSKLTDKSKIQVFPEVIKVVKLDKAMSLKEALSNYKVKNTRHNEFAILNGMQLKDQLQRGDMIKVVQVMSESN